MNILVVFPQIRYIEVFDITSPPFNEQIWLVPSDFVKSRFHCTIFLIYKIHLLSFNSSFGQLWYDNKIEKKTLPDRIDNARFKSKINELFGDTKSPNNYIFDTN